MSISQKDQHHIVDASDGRLNRVTRSITNFFRTGFGRCERGLVDLKYANRYAHPVSSMPSQNSRDKVMVTPSPNEVTQLLAQWRDGDKAALDKLTPLVYDELRRLADYYLRGERKDHTLQGTALVHEAYIRLIGQENLDWQSRAHFFGVAARLMRQILIDHARKHKAAKRGSGERNLSLTEAAIFSKERASELVALDEALRGLAVFDPKRGRIVELRYFGGLSIEEIAEVERISVATVRRQLRVAEAWLHREISK